MKLRPLVFGSAIALSLAGAAIAQQQTDWNVIEVTATEIRPGVAVLFGNGGNIGVSDGPDGTLIVDDQSRRSAEDPGGDRRPRGEPGQVLVNTIWHFDHAGGNEPFGKAGEIIVAQTRVRDRLAAGGTWSATTRRPRRRKRSPVVTYDHGMTFDLNGETIDLVNTRGGHTDGDTVVYWRKANVLPPATS